MKVVISHGWGGFIPSSMICRRFAARKKADTSDIKLGESALKTGWIYNPSTISEAWILSNYKIDSIEFRSDPDLVSIVEDEISKGHSIELQVVDIPEEFRGKIQIDNYDGNEYVASSYQTWGRSHEFGNDR